MSVLSELELVQGSHILENRLILEPIIDSKQALPFLESQVINPEVFRAGILQLNQILMAHPGVNLNRIYDPVVSVTENYVDFEGFARFGHSYCKIRFPEKLFSKRIRQEGVTNVDFNPTFIRDLRSRYYTRKLWVYIDPDGIEFAIENRSHLLQKIAMPKWWKDAYKELDNYIDRETLELQFAGENANLYNKVILSGWGFQQLVKEIEYKNLLKKTGVRSLTWDEKSVTLLYNGQNETKSASVNLIKPCKERIRSWGVWRIQNLSDIANQIIQADVYIAEKLPSFWILHARSGVELLIGYTLYTNTLWTETARKDIDELLKDPYKDFEPRSLVRRRKRRNIKRQNKIKKRINFAVMHPGQRIIPEYISN